MRQGELPRSEPAEDGNRDQRCKADHRGPTERQFAKSRPAEFSTIGLPLKSVKAFHDEVRSARQTTGPRKPSIAKLFHCLNYPAGLELHGLSRASPRISSRGSAPHYHLVRSRSNPAGANLARVVFVRIFVALTVSGRTGYRDRRRPRLRARWPLLFPSD